MYRDLMDKKLSGRLYENGLELKWVRNKSNFFSKSGTLATYLCFY